MALKDFGVSRSMFYIIIVESRSIIFPMHLKEMEYRFSHGTENLFKQFLKIYFRYVSP